MHRNSIRLIRIVLVAAVIQAVGCSSRDPVSNTQEAIVQKGNINGTAAVDTLEQPLAKDPYFPFELLENGQYVIRVNTGRPELYPSYYNFFKRYGYTANGDCWAGHIMQVLQQLDPELLLHLDFDPEAGAFYAYADTKANQLRFAKLLAPIFSDTTKLEVYVKSADRQQIDD